MPAHHSKPSFTVLLVLACLPAACGPSGARSPPDAAVDAGAPGDADAGAPDAGLTGIIGTWAESPTGYYLRFAADGTQRLGATVAGLDSRPLETGVWKLEGAQLTFTNETGLCAGTPSVKVGVYATSITATSLTFTLVSDPCPQRNVIDGQTWTRLEL